jgi:hypothetical protein
MKIARRLQSGLTCCSLILGTLLMEGCYSSGNSAQPDPAPTVTASSLSPANGAANVPVATTTITAAFSEAMTPASLGAASFTLECPAGTPAAGTVSYGPTGNLATFTLAAGTQLPSFTVCTATLTTAAEDLAGTPLAAPYVWTFTTGADLGMMAVLAGTSIENMGPTAVIGNIGVYPGTAVSGFPPGVATGQVFNGGAVAAQAQAGLATAYGHYLGLASTTNLSGTNLGGLTLAPGVYSFSAAAQLTGNLTLDASGDPGAVFVMRIGSTLTTASSSSVTLLNHAQSGNVFWLVGSSVTLAPNTAFQGNLMAQGIITLDTAATVQGRVLTTNGSIVMDSNNIGPVAP